MFLELFLVIILILLNGFFVAAEFAIVKVRETQLVSLVMTGVTRAKVAHHIVQNLNEYLSAAQLGITITSLGLGWIAEPVFEHVLSPLFSWVGIQDMITIKALSAGFGFTLITFLHITLGELCPKALAIQFPKQTTLFIALPFKLFNTVFRPLIILLNGSANLFLRMIGIEPASEQDSHHSEEELRLLLREGKRTGVIDDTEQKMIENVFDFADTSVGEILVPRTQMCMLQADASFDEAMRLITREGYSRVPVYGENHDDIIGVISSKDILKGIVEGQTQRLRDLMRPPMFIVKTTLLGHLLREMQKKHVELAIVLNEYGGIEGMITSEDLLEEIVGEIQDEHDAESAKIYRVNENTFIAQSVATIEEFNEVVRVHIPESAQYSSIGGFVLTLFGHIPVKGERVVHDDVEFRAEQVARNRIVSLRVVKKVEPLIQ